LKKAEEIRKEQFAKQHPNVVKKEKLISKAHEKKQILDKENIERKSKCLTKLEIADKKREQSLNTTIEKAHKESEKLSKAQKLRELKNSEIASKTKEILNKHDHGFKKSKEEHEKIIEKAKTHVAKVQESVEQVKIRKAKELELKRADIEQKILKATEKRQIALGKVKETATMLYQKRSPSKDLAQNDPVSQQ